MKRHWKKIVGAVVAVDRPGPRRLVHLRQGDQQGRPGFGQDDVNAKLDSATTTIAADPDDASRSPPRRRPRGRRTGRRPDDHSSPSQAAPVGVDGLWTIADGSEVGYRVDESINGFDTTANGRTQAITGSMTIGRHHVTEGEFTVDMTTFKSDESKRDAQFNGRIMDVDNFPDGDVRAHRSRSTSAQIPAEGRHRDGDARPAT